MNKNKRSLLLSIVLIISLTACNLPTVQSTDVPELTSTVQTSTPESPTPELALTITAQARLLETLTPDFPLTITAQALTLEASSSTPEVQELATEFTLTPSTTTVTVSRNTNCRKGPGSQFDINGALLIGQVAEVIAKNTPTNYWIIKTPGSSSGTCWLWGQYATVSGDTSAVAEATLPPTPIVPPSAVAKTTLPPADPSNLSEVHTCTVVSTSPSKIYQHDVTISWQDNSSNEDGFKIYSSIFVDPSDGTKLEGTVGANSTSYTVSASSFGGLSLFVEAFNSAGTSKRVLIESGCP